jgi:hypothetical protein
MPPQALAYSEIDSQADDGAVTIGDMPNFPQICNQNTRCGGSNLTHTELLSLLQQAESAATGKGPPCPVKASDPVSVSFGQWMLTREQSYHTSPDLTQTAVNVRRFTQMAHYANAGYLNHSTNAQFNYIHNPGQIPQIGGIYRCTGCGKEVTCAIGHTLPPQNHHQHTPFYVPIKWQLVVAHN